MRCAMRARLRLALVEEGVAYALAAMARKQDRLTEIESASNVETRGGERLLPCRVLRGERRRGGCADNIFAVARDDDHGALGGCEVGEIAGLITGVAIVEIGKIRSEETTSELQALMRTSYGVFCVTKKIKS